jgi:hypothetical protein
VNRWSSLALALAFCSGAASAEWTALGGGDNIHVPYADKASIRALGANVSMAGLYDFRRGDLTPEGRPFLSTVVLREYDCRSRQVRLLSYIDFSDHMGTGSAVTSVKRTGRWEQIVEGALDEAYWRVACGQQPR